MYFDHVFEKAKPSIVFVEEVIPFVFTSLGPKPNVGETFAINNDDGTKTIVIGCQEGPVVFQRHKQATNVVVWSVEDKVLDMAVLSDSKFKDWCTEQAAALYAAKGNDSLPKVQQLVPWMVS